MYIIVKVQACVQGHYCRAGPIQGLTQLNIQLACYSRKGATTTFELFMVAEQ